MNSAGEFYDDLTTARQPEMSVPLVTVFP